MHATHQNHRAHEGDIGEEIARLREARSFELKLTGVRPQEVWIHEQTKLGSSDEEGRHETPDLRKGPQREDVASDPCNIVRIDEVHVHWHRESNRDCG